MKKITLITLLTLFLLGQKTYAADMYDLSYKSVPSNALPILLPIIEKTASSSKALVATSLKSNFSLNFNQNSSGKNYVYSFGSNTNTQNIFNPFTKENETNQISGAVTYSIDPKSSIGLGKGLNSGTISFSTRYFKTKKGHDVYINITGIPEALNKTVKELSKNSGFTFKLNTWYKYSFDKNNNPLKLGVAPVVSTTKNNQDIATQNLLFTKILLSNLTLKQDFGIEKIAAGNARHLRLGITHDGIRNIIEAFDALDPKNAASRRSMSSLLTSPDTAQILNSTNLDVWIGVTDSRIYKITLSSNASGSIPQVTLNSRYDTPKDTYSLTFTLSSEAQSINVVPKITPPKTFVDFNKIIQKSITDAQNRGKEASLKALASNMRAFAELYYSTNKDSYAGFCTQPKGTGIDSLLTSIKTNGGTVNCKATPTQWIATIQINSKSYICVDSKGSMTTLTTDRALQNIYRCQ